MEKNSLHVYASRGSARNWNTLRFTLVRQVVKGVWLTNARNSASDCLLIVALDHLLER